MKEIIKIKFIAGLTLISFPVIGGIIFLLEGREIVKHVFTSDETSFIWDSDMPTFLGLCGLAGAYLLASIKPKEDEISSVSNKDKIQE